jgi:hypothetical protein
MEKVRSSTCNEVVELCGKVGGGRTTAARLLAQKLAVLDERARAAGLKRPGQTPVPPLRVQVVDGPDAPAVGPRTLNIHVKETDPRRNQALHSILPWAASEVAQVTEELALLGVLQTDSVEKMRAFASAVAADPELLGSDRRPPAVLAQLARAGTEGVPADRRDARSRTVAAAWRQGLVRLAEADPLRNLDEKVLAAFWAHRVATTNVVDWTSLTEEEAFSCARAVAMRGRFRRDADLTVLVAELEKATSRERLRARQAIDHRLALDEPAHLVERMVVAGWLDREPGGGWKARDPELACTAAALGLAEDKRPCLAPAMADALSGQTVAQELGFVGVSADKFAGMSRHWPAAAGLEGARLRILHAAALSDAELRDADLHALAPDWAALLLADLGGVGAWTTLAGTVPWTEEVGPVLRALARLSIRASGIWPDLDAEAPNRVLDALVTQDVAAVIAAWEQVRDAADAQAKCTGEAPCQPYWLRARDGDDNVEHRTARRLRKLAPGQTLPWHVSDARAAQNWMRATKVPDWTKAMVLRAERDERARAWLAGEHIPMRAGDRRGYSTPDLQANAPDAAVWRTASCQARLRWIAARARGAPEERARALVATEDLGWNSSSRELRISGEIWSDWLRVLQTQPRDHVAKELIAVLTRQGNAEWLHGLADDTALRLARELGLREVLIEVLRTPGRWLATARAFRWGGREFVQGEGRLRFVPRGSMEDAEGWAELDLWEDLAHRAAIELWLVGDRDALRARWRDGLGWTLPQRLRADLEALSITKAAGRRSLATVAASSPDRDSLLAWLDRLAEVLAKGKYRERSMIFGRPFDPNRELAEYATQARSDVPLAVQAATANWHRFHPWLDREPKDRASAWNEALQTPPESLSPEQRVACFVLDLLACWTRSEVVAPLLPWLKRLVPPSRAPLRPLRYPDAAELLQAEQRVRTRALEAMLELGDDWPIEQWLVLPDRPVPDDMRSLDQKLAADDGILRRALHASSPGSPGRQRVLVKAGLMQPPPAWLVDVALTEGTRAIERAAEAIGRIGATAKLHRRLAELATDRPERTGRLWVLREIEPDCAEWPAHVREWLLTDPAPFAGRGDMDRWSSQDGGFLLLFTEASRLVGTGLASDEWRRGLQRLRSLWPLAKAEATAALEAIEEAADDIGETIGEPVRRGPDRVRRWDAERKVRDLDDIRESIRSALARLGDVAALETDAATDVQALEQGTEPDSDRRSAVVAHLARWPIDELAGRLERQDAVGRFLLHAASRQWPNFNAALVAWAENTLRARLADPKSVSLDRLDVVLNNLDDVARERVPAFVDELLANPDPLVIAIIWRACLYRSDEVGRAVKKSCTEALFRLGRHPEQAEGREELP